MAAHSLKAWAVLSGVVLVSGIVGLVGVALASTDDGDDSEIVRPTLDGGAVVRVRPVGPRVIEFAPAGVWTFIHSAELIEEHELGEDKSLSSAGRLFSAHGEVFEHADYLPVGIAIESGMLWNRNQSTVRVFLTNEGIHEFDIKAGEALLFGSVDNIQGFSFIEYTRGCRCDCVNSNGQVVYTAVYECSCNCANEVGNECLNAQGNQVGVAQNCRTVIFPSP